MLSSTPLSSGSNRGKVLAELQAERDRRLKAKSDRLTQYATNPVGFVEMGLLGALWSKQREICEAIVKHRHVAVASCHDVGKSRTAALIAGWFGGCHPPGEAFIVTLAPTMHQVRAILWRELSRVHAEGQLPGHLNQTEWKLPSGELIGMGRSPKDTDPTAIQGIHQLRVLVIFDEACGIGKPLWDAADTLVANEYSRFLAIGNPDDPSSEFAQVCKPGSGWHVIHISAFDSPNFTGEPIPDWLRPLLVSKTWVEERRRRWGEGSPLWQSKVLGRFPEQAADGLIPISAVTAAVNREAVPGEPNELGVDVARFGVDSTSIYNRRGMALRRINKFNNRDLMYVCGQVVDAVRTTGARCVKIDDAGLGGGVTDRLMEMKRTREVPILANVMIVPINVGEKPVTNDATERFKNLRAELNWAMRERFTRGDIAIEPLPDGQPDEDLQAQTVDIKYEMTSRGQIQIESKEDLKKRGRPSPDDWDAAVLAFASPAGTMPLVITEEMLARI